MLNGLDPDQDRYCVGPDLGPNCFQRLSEDNKSLSHGFRFSLSVKETDAFTLCMLGNFPSFCCRLLYFFSKFPFSKNSFRNTIRVSNCMHPKSADNKSSMTAQIAQLVKRPLSEREVMGLNPGLTIPKV